MSNWIIYGIGFLAQGLFSARSLFQWILSERHKKVLTPSLFWKLSLLAAFLLFVYGDLRDDFAIMLGQSVTYFIYIRNLQLQGEWKKAPKFLRWFLWVFPLLIGIYFYNNSSYDLHRLFSREEISLWLLILGTIAQLLFNFRFVYQWIYSERKKKSSLPLGFWILSLSGGLLILTYAVFRRDPVLFLGHLAGSFIYARNIYLNQKYYAQA